MFLLGKIIEVGGKVEKEKPVRREGGKERWCWGVVVVGFVRGETKCEEPL